MKDNSGYFEIKKSKFYSFVFLVNSEKEIKEKLADIQKQYKDARHVVYAYRVEEDGILREKFYNDKEPTGTAGQPLLFLLKKKGLMNTLLVVVRYFGGVKLGAGGLMRAYKSAGLDALEK